MNRALKDRRSPIPLFIAAAVLAMAASVWVLGDSQRTAADRTVARRTFLAALAEAQRLGEGDDRARRLLDRSTQLAAMWRSSGDDAIRRGPGRLPVSEALYRTRIMGAFRGVHRELRAHLEERRAAELDRVSRRQAAPASVGSRRSLRRRMERRVEITPRWAFRMPVMTGCDAVARRRRGVLTRLMHVGDEPVVVRAAQSARDRVVIAVEGRSPQACDRAVERTRFWLGLDDDLRDFHDRFRDDPLIGRVVRMQPWLRAPRRPQPFEALAWAITEQLIDFPRAAAIQRRIVFRLGRRCPRTGLRDLPSPAKLAAQAPAFLQSLDLSAGRSVAMIRCAREVAAGRVDLHAGDHEAGWRRLRAIPGIGPWTLEILALHGQGRHDQVPAGDLNLLKLVGRMRTGNPFARASEDEVRELFAPYAPWSGLAAVYALRSGAATGPRAPAAPRPGRTRSSGRVAGPLAA